MLRNPIGSADNPFVIISISIMIVISIMMIVIVIIMSVIIVTITIIMSILMIIISSSSSCCSICITIGSAETPFDAPHAFEMRLARPSDDTGS